MPPLPPQPSPRKRRFPLKWLLILAIALALWQWGTPLLRGNAKPPIAPTGEAMPARVSSVLRAPVTVWREFSGRIEAVRTADIRPRVSGEITQVLFNDGAEVKRGQHLFALDSRPFDAELQRAKGTLAQAESTTFLATQEFARAKTLIASKAISKAEWEQKQSNLSQAQGSLEAARGALKAAEVNLSYTHITAPIGGRISRAEITEGNQVEAGPNAPLLASIVKLQPVYVGFELDEQSVTQLVRGMSPAKLKHMPVEILPANAASAPIHATLHDIDNQLSASGTLRMRASIANKDNALMPGFFARVRIGSADQEDAVLIHPEAVGTDQDKKFVYVVGAEGKIEYRVVTLGETTDGLQIITNGLAEGEQIVVAGLQRMRPGVLVQPIASDMRTLAPVVEAGNDEMTNSSIR